MFCGISKVDIEKVTANLKSDPVERVILLLKLALELDASGCIMLVVIPILVSERDRYIPT
jgi:hypothetical protein